MHGGRAGDSRPYASTPHTLPSVHPAPGRHALAEPATEIRQRCWTDAVLILSRCDNCHRRPEIVALVPLRFVPTYCCWPASTVTRTGLSTGAQHAAWTAAPSSGVSSV